MYTPAGNGMWQQCEQPPFSQKACVQGNGNGRDSKGVLSSTWWAHSDTPVEDERPPPQTLVLYIFSNSDPEYIDNLRFYVRTAIHEDDGCHHVIVVNAEPDSTVRTLSRCAAAGDDCRGLCCFWFTPTPMCHIRFAC